ncbi:MAG TPA: sensor histidine kinase [Chitinophagaceae bacterium]
MKSISYNRFIFSPRYRIWRHLLYWSVHIMIWAGFWNIMVPFFTYERTLIKEIVWMPMFLLLSYPFIYWVVPNTILKGKVIEFILIVLAWGVAALFINRFYRDYVYIPFQEAMNYKDIVRSGGEAGSYLCMATTTASCTVIRLFKYLIIKQQEWMQAQKEKVAAELQLLKAQLHPHLLFNTLNNIYSFSLEQSPKTPGMILKLSSLLSYMLYDCRTDEVRLEKEIEIMKNYVDLEKERYGERIEISWNSEGEISDKFIAPFLMLPFLENAFKHGTSEQIEKPWLGVDISVKNDVLKCKIANSKNEYVVYNNNGIGISNVKKRLELIYPDNYELKMSDEGNFYVVSMVVKLNGAVTKVPSLLKPEMQESMQTDYKPNPVFNSTL